MREIDVVEIDPEVTRVVYEYLGLPRSTTIRSFNEDGRWFVMNSKDKGRYDFIFGDAFNDLSIPYHLTTKEFAQQMKELLKPDGFLIANLIDSVTEGLFLPSYIRTLEEVFGKGNVNLLVLAPELRTARDCHLRRCREPEEVGHGGLRPRYRQQGRESHDRQYRAPGEPPGDPPRTPVGDPHR